MIKLQNQIKPYLINYTRLVITPLVKKLLLLTAVVLSVFLILLNGVTPEKYALKVGDISDYDIKAPRDFVDEYATKIKIDKAVAAVKPKYDLDNSVLQNAQNEAENFFDVFLNASDKNKPDAKVIKGYVNVNDSMISYLETLNKDQLSQLKTIAINVLHDILSKPVSIDSLNDTKANARNKLLVLDISNKSRNALIDIMDLLIKPNMIYNEEETKMAKMEAAQSVDKIIYKKGQSIVKSGDMVTKNQYRLLKDMGLLKDETHTDIWLILGIGVFSLLSILTISAYIQMYKKEYRDDINKLMLLSIIFVLILSLVLVFKGVSVYLIPFASLAMLVTVIFDYSLALVCTFVFFLLSGTIVGFTPELISIGVIGPVLGIFMLSKAEHRNAFMWSGMAVGVLSVISIISLGLINSSEISMVLKESPWGFLNGVISTVLTIGTLPFWEAVFGVVTPMRLVELSNPNQPLLKKLLFEAPGTYHHSIIVSNLAEAAALEIHANGLLARVGAYYHDIGKIKRPYFFKENQLTIDNPHDKISPDLSSLIIISHVKDGVNIAKKYRIPCVIKDIIEQHHGTTLVSYFYNKALNDQAYECDERDYRYPGPRPTTKEAALVMLADATEAAVRSLSNPNEESIDNMIKKIISMRLEDGQFDQCNLTFKDLDGIKKAFKRVLTGIFHDRIEYPENNTVEEN